MATLFLALAENVALLLALAMVYSFALRRWRPDSPAGQVAVGLAFGAVAVAGMFRPVPLATGLFFDGRTIVLAVGALVAGPLAALLSASLAAAVRLIMGGVGLAPGLLTIASSAALGILFRHLRRSRPAWEGSRGLLVFGLAVHVTMLLCMFSLPRELALLSIQRIALPVLTLFPLGTLLLAKLMFSQEELVRGRQAIEASERRIRLLADNATDILIVLSAQQELIYVSPACEGILGYTPAEMTRFTMAELAHPEDQAALSQALAGRSEGAGGLSVVYRARRQDGGYLWLESRIRHLLDPESAIERVVVVSRDISDRHAIEAALAETRMIQRAMLDTIPDSAWMKDAQGVYLGANAPFAASCGQAPEDIPGKTDAELRNDPELAERLRADDNRAMSERRPVRVEETLTLPSGEQVWYETVKSPVLDDEGEVVGTVGIARDITERRHIELEQRRLATAIEQSTDSVLVVDADSVILYANPAFERMTGHDRAEVLGRPSHFLLDDPGAKAELDLVFASVIAGQQWRGARTWRRKDGSLLPTMATLAPIPDEDGKISSVVSVNFDLSELRSMEARLFQAQKMEALGTLAGGIAHDFNNVLGAIIGYAEMAELAEPPGNTVQRYLTEVLSAANRAKDLVQQILSFSRREAPERQPVAVGEAITETLALLRASIPSTVSVKVDDRSEDAMVMAAPSQLHQVLLNLGTNAAQAMAAAGGAIEISLERLQLDAPHTWTGPALPPGDYLQLRVADSGPGLDPALLSRVFEPFFTTKGPGEGTGMGLSVAHGVVATLGGSIEARSTPGQGFVVEILLPRLLQTAAPPEPASLPVGRVSARILIAEDKPALLELYRLALVQAGHSVSTAPRGDEALERFRRDPSAFDFLITDQVMPGLTGLALAAAVREVRPGLPILIMTGYSDVDLKVRAGELGISEILQKPVGAKKLVQVVGRILMTAGGGAETHND